MNEKRRCDMCVCMYVYIYIYNGILLSHKKYNAAICSKWVDIENIMLSEISQTEKDKYCMATYMWNLKFKQMNIYSKTETHSQIRKTVILLKW